MTTFIAASSASPANSGIAISQVMPVPGGTLDGNLMVLAVSFLDDFPSGVARYVVGGLSAWTLRGGALRDATGLVTYIYTRVAASEPASYTVTLQVVGTPGNGPPVATLTIGSWASATTDILGVTQGSLSALGSPITVTAPSVAFTGAVFAIHMFATYSTTSGGPINRQWTAGSGLNNRAATSGYHNIQALLGDSGTYGTTPTTARTADLADTGGGAYPSQGSGFTLLVAENNPPYAPTPITPIGGAVVDRTAVNRFRWAFADPDPGDSQSAFEVRYRVVGAGSWTTTGTLVTPNQFYDLAAATITAGDYEWQARTQDAIGAQGPWSSSSFFTAADPSGSPSITNPTDGSVIPSTPWTVTWSTPSQTDYEWRRVADNAGVPDTGTVYADSGDVIDTVARFASVPFPINNRFEHLQLRIKTGGLWTAWASTRVRVAYTQPDTPTLSVAVTQYQGADAALTVTVTNP